MPIRKKKTKQVLDEVMQDFDLEFELDNDVLAHIKKKSIQDIFL